MLKLTTNGNSLVVEGVGNGTFPMDGNCSYPMNSLIVQTDESTEMVTFRSASTNDVLFSGIIGEVTINGETVTKDTIVAKFDSVANSPTGGGGGGGTVNAYTKSESDALFATKSELEATSTVANEADSKADAVTSRIEDVETAMDNKQDILVSGANIKTVNGQSIVGEGNVQINVPDAYTKAETDELLEGKENAGTAYTKAEANELLSAKEDKGTSYTKAQSDAKYALTGTSYTKGEEDNLLAGKENVGTSYTKAESDAKYLTEHQSLENYYNKTQTDNLLSAKENAGTSYTKAESDEKYLTEHQSLADYYTKEQADGLLAGKANVGVSYTKAESDEKYLTTHQDISGLATKEEVEAKQDKLIAGYGIGIDGNTIRVTLDGSLFVLVQTLPTEGINPDKIYVVPNSEGVEGNVATEYIYVNGKWEELGKFKADVDLSLYYTKGETDTLLSSKANTGVSYTKAEEDALLGAKANSADVYTKQQADAKFLTEHQSLSDYATKAEVNSKQDTLVSGTNIKTVNGTSLLGNGDVAINVPDSYTKTETDNLLATKADTENVYSKQQADAKFLTEHQSLANYATKAELNNKADVGTSYTKVESDAKYATQQEADDMAADISALEADMQGKQATLVSGTNIKTVNGTSLLGEGNVQISVPDAYTKAETDELLGGKENVGVAYTKAQSDAKYLTEHQSLENYYNKTQTNELLAGKAPVGASYTKEESDGKYLTEHQSLAGYATKEELNAKANSADVYTKTQADEKFLTEHQSLENYATKEELATKAPVGASYTKEESDAKYLTEHQSLADYATKAEVNGKQDTLVSGTNIKTINNQSILGEGDITIEGGSGGSEGTTYTLSDIDFFAPYNKTSYNSHPIYKAVVADVTFDQVNLGDILVDKNGNTVKVVTVEKDWKGGYVSNDDATRFVGFATQNVLGYEGYNFAAHNVMRIGSYENLDGTITQDSNIKVPSTAQQAEWDNTAYIRNYFNNFNMSVEQNGIPGSKAEYPTSFAGVGVTNQSPEIDFTATTFDQYSLFFVSFTYEDSVEYTIGKGAGTGNLIQTPQMSGYVTINADGSWTIPTVYTFEDSNMWASSIVYINGEIAKQANVEAGMTWNVGDKVRIVNPNFGSAFLFNSWQNANTSIGINVQYKKYPQSDQTNHLVNLYNGVPYLIRNEANEWVGTQAEYDAIAAKDNNIIYYIVEE